MKLWFEGRDGILLEVPDFGELDIWDAKDAKRIIDYLKSMVRDEEECNCGE